MLDKIKIDSLNLKPKLVIAFVLVALLVGVTGAIGYTSVTEMDHQVHLIVDKEVAEADAAMEMKYAIRSERLALHEVLLGETEASSEFQESAQNFDKWHARMTELDLSEDQQALLSEMKADHEKAVPMGEEVIAAQEAGDSELANQKMDELDSVHQEMAADSAEFETNADEEMDATVASADSTANTAKNEVIGLTILALLGAIGIGLFVARRITPSIKQLSDAAVGISQGDLDKELEAHSEDDEIGRMVEAFMEMKANLQQVFGNLDDVSQNLKAGTLDQDVRTDFPGTYGRVMGNIDDGTHELTESFDDIQGVSNDLSTGVLDRAVDTDRPGDYGAVLTDLETGMDRLSESFDEIATASEGLKTGDLDRRLETDYPGDYGVVMENLEAGIEQLNESIESIQEIADETAASSEEVASSTEEIEAASEQVANSVEEISQGAESQSGSLQEVAGEMNDMTATVEEIASSAEEVTTTASTAVDRSETGQEYAADASEEIESIEAQADQAADQVETLDERMDEIGEIVEMITGIAEQTNMLALNASIEAARAGEAGEGFAVVADEIKGLAGEVGEATTDIEERITAVQSTTSETVEGMEEMSERIERGSDTIEEAIEMFDEIADAVQDAESGIQEIGDATDDQASSSEEVVSMVDEVSSVSQQTAAEASNVSAATEEQTSSLSEVSQSVQHLSQLSDGLHEQVSQFETRDDVSAGMTPAADPAADPGAAGPAGLEADGGRGATDGGTDEPSEDEQ
jgi:methyl-accepting chemotaxis protein